MTADDNELPFEPNVPYRSGGGGVLATPRIDPRYAWVLVPRELLRRVVLAAERGDVFPEGQMWCYGCGTDHHHEGCPVLEARRLAWQ